jgi:hypothetical protein
MNTLAALAATTALTLTGLSFTPANPPANTDFQLPAGAKVLEIELAPIEVVAVVKRKPRTMYAQQTAPRATHQTLRFLQVL